MASVFDGFKIAFGWLLFKITVVMLLFVGCVVLTGD